MQIAKLSENCVHCSDIRNNSIINKNEKLSNVIYPAASSTYILLYRLILGS